MNTKQIVEDIAKKNLNGMRQSVNVTLAEKAAHALEEKKKTLATSYFKKK